MTQTVLLTLLNINLFLLFPVLLKKKKRLELPYEFTTMGVDSMTKVQVIFFACGALAASISLGIVIPSTWFVYLYKQTVSITVVVMGTKQFSDKTTHRQQVKTGFVQKWENRSPGLLQDYSRISPFFKDSISSQFCIAQRFKVHFFSVRSGEMNRRTQFL